MQLSQLELTTMKLFAAIFDKERETARFAEYRAGKAKYDLESYIRDLAEKYDVKNANINLETGELTEEEQSPA